MANKMRRLGLSIFVTVFSLYYVLAPAIAGTLEFDGVPVDITTVEAEDLVIVPGTGGSTQIGTGTTNANVAGNNDLYVSGILEADGIIYADGGLVSGTSMIPSTTAVSNLGSSTKYWNIAYLTNIYAGDIGKIKDISYSWPSTQGAASTYLKNDGSGNLTWATTSGGAPVAISGGATNAALGSVFTFSSSSDTTLGVPTNPTDGQRCIWKFTNSGGSSVTLSLTTSSGGFRFGTTVTGLTATTAGKTDYIGAIYNSAGPYWDVVAYAKGY